MGEPQKAKHNSFRRRKTTLLPLILISLIIILSASFASVYNQSFKPVLKELARYRAECISNAAVNSAVGEILRKDSLKYEETVYITRDSDGKVTSLSLNFSELNPLLAQFIENVNERVYKNDRITVYIPLGNLTGCELFSGTGPLIPVNMIPSSNTTANLKSDFTAAGINQTRHRLSFKVVSRISLLLPGSIGLETVSEYEIPVSESIIAGLVPDTLTQVVTSEGEIREDIMNLQ